jgi:hypothetical protein
MIQKAFISTSIKRDIGVSAKLVKIVDGYYIHMNCLKRRSASSSHTCESGLSGIELESEITVRHEGKSRIIVCIYA